MLEPELFRMVFNYLDLRSISRVECCCVSLQGMVVETSIYRRRWLEVCERRGEDGGTVTQTPVESSRHYKMKLAEYYLR